jgi:hypothetical protein
MEEKVNEFNIKSAINKLLIFRINFLVFKRD